MSLNATKNPHIARRLLRIGWNGSQTVKSKFQLSQTSTVGDMINDRLEALSVLAAVEEQSTMRKRQNVSLRSH